MFDLNKVKKIKAYANCGPGFPPGCIGCPTEFCQDCMIEYPNWHEEEILKDMINLRFNCDLVKHYLNIKCDKEKCDSCKEKVWKWLKTKPLKELIKQVKNENK